MDNNKPIMDNSKPIIDDPNKNKPSMKEVGSNLKYRFIYRAKSFLLAFTIIWLIIGGYNSSKLTYYIVLAVLATLTIICYYYTFEGQIIEIKEGRVKSFKDLDGKTLMAIMFLLVIAGFIIFFEFFYK